jgi:hypothetical protein
MAEVLLSTDDLTVLGGPARIELETDFGAAGQRGSLIYASNGVPTNPNSGIPDDVLPYDLAINISASSTRYLTVYQYFSADGVSGWNELTRLSPNAGSANLDITFANGISQLIPGINGIGIPVASITENTSVTPANFNIQYSIESALPVLSGMQVSPTFIVDENNVPYLGFTIIAYVVNPITQQVEPLNGVVRKVHLFITVV